MDCPSWLQSLGRLCVQGHDLLCRTPIRVCLRLLVDQRRTNSFFAKGSLASTGGSRVLGLFLIHGLNEDVLVLIVKRPDVGKLALRMRVGMLLLTIQLWLRSCEEPSTWIMTYMLLILLANRLMYRAIQLELPNSTLRDIQIDDEVIVRYLVIRSLGAITTLLIVVIVSGVVVVVGLVGDANIMSHY